jgi:hypothetical protein
LTLLRLHLALVGHVALISYEDFADAGLTILLDFRNPSAHVVEGIAVRHVVHYYNALGPAVIARS